MDDLKKAQAEVVKLQAEKAHLHAEIAQYGQDLEALHGKIVRAEALQVNIDALNQEIAALEAKKTSLAGVLKELDAAKAQKTAILIEIETYQKTIEDTAEKNKALSVATDALTAIETKVSTAENRLADLQANIKLANDSLASTTTKINDQEKAFTDRGVSLQTKHTQKETESTAALIAIDTTIASRASQKSAIDTSITDANVELLAVEAKIKAKADEYESLDALYETKKAQKEEDIAAMDKGFTDREAKINKGEGDISLKNAALDQKRRSLEIIKMRLEKERGETINIEL